MSKRSPFWHAFTAKTPLGYSIAGHFNTEPGPNYGTLRFTHVDGPLPRPYVSPGLPEHARLAPASDLPGRTSAVDMRLIERPDGTLVAFYPLFDADGALVEVVPRTRDTPVVIDTPWRPLATLVGAVRHAGIEEAVRRQRAVFVFALLGSENARLVRYPFALRLVLHSVLRGNGRVLATYPQVRGWANHYGLDLPTTSAELSLQLSAAEFATQIAEAQQAVRVATQDAAAIGDWTESGSLLWISGRAGADLVDLPAGPPPYPGTALAPIDVWDAMARLADRALTPTRERTAATLTLPGTAPDSAALASIIGQDWERWARLYPEAFSALEEERVAV